MSKMLDNYFMGTETEPANGVSWNMLVRKIFRLSKMFVYVDVVSGKVNLVIFQNFQEGWFSKWCLQPHLLHS